VRTSRYVYVEHYRAEVPTLEEGFGLPIGVGELTDVELYDLKTDRHELVSHHADPTYAVTRAALAGATAQLRGCAGDECAVDLAPPEPG
jgi:hypothetical protein